VCVLFFILYNNIFYANCFFNNIRQHFKLESNPRDQFAQKNLEINKGRNFQENDAVQTINVYYHPYQNNMLHNNISECELRTANSFSKIMKRAKQLKKNSLQ